MAFVVVTSLLDMVEQQLLQLNPSSIHNGNGIVVPLLHKLRLRLHFLQAFLEEFGAKINRPRAMEADIRGVAAKIEGEIKALLPKDYQAANRGEMYIFQEYYVLSMALEQAVRDIEKIKSRIFVQYANGFSYVGSSTNYFREMNVLVGGSLQYVSDTENEIIVGFDEDIEEIVRMVIIPESIERDIISIVGEGGIGKTTLAKVVFQDQRITTVFEIRAWVVVSKEYNLKEMLIGLLRCIMPITREISNMDEAHLEEQLRRSLMGKRYLIFLDDVWTTEVWYAIQRCFPCNSNERNPIMITTRIVDVAEHLSYFCDIKRMKFQNLENSWKLFSMKVFGVRRFCPPVLEKLGRQISSQCQGLPLAIIVIARFLATTTGSLEVWREVAETLDGMDWADDKTSKILFLSYDYLPSQLKACFLYFGVFPRNCCVPIKKLINLWVAEGFLKPEKNKSLEEVAKNCLLDLTNRSLVQVDKVSIDGKMKECKIHDRLHEICLKEAEKENIVRIIDETHALQVCRWISCQSRHWPITQASCGENMSSEIHSILFFGKEFYFSKCKLVYSCLKVLTVLDLSLVKYLHGMPSGITDLIHLRYLALRTIGSLYKFRLLKLQNLQTLIVCSWMEEYPLQLACDILDLPQLRHLHLEKRCSQYLPSVVRENLQTLYWLKVTSLERKPDFRMAPNLKELGIYIEGELLPGYVESLVHLHLLEKLKFEIGRVEQFYLPNAFPSNLKKLTFHHTYLPWEKMGVIGKLQKLEVLKLKDFAFHGSKWEPKDGEFGVLKVLLIAHSNIKQWNANVHHFPVLERLILRYCWDLEKVPYCFAKIGTMKLIVLDSCTSSLVASTNLFSSTNMLLFMKMPNEALRIRCVGTKVELPNNESSESQGPCAQMACSDVPIGEFMRSSPNRGDRKVLKAILQCNRGDRKVLKALKRNALRLSELKVELPNNESSESQGPCAQMACSDVPIGEFMRSSPNRGDRKVLKAILQCNRDDRKVLNSCRANISINCNMLAVDCMCVAIDQAVDIDAPLPFPLSSSCQHVGDAVGSHVKWPTSFIKVQHEKQCKKKSGHHEKKLELNSSSMPESLWLLYCYYKRALDNGETIKVILDFDVFGKTCTLYVNEEDVTRFCQLMPISYTCIGVYIWSLYKKMMDENKLDKFRFVYPYGVGLLPTTKTDTQFLEEQLEKRARALVDRLFDTPPNTAVLVPCNVGFHWILTVININKDIIYLLDPLGHRMRNDNWKHVVDMAMKMFHAVGKGKKGRSKTSWEIVKAPRQPDSSQCGFYVMAYMRTLIEHMPDIDDKESVQALFQQADYNQTDIDQVRSEWADSVSSDIQ